MDDSGLPSGPHDGQPYVLPLAVHLFFLVEQVQGVIKSHMIKNYGLSDDPSDFSHSPESQKFPFTSSDLTLGLGIWGWD